jgi:hypothetical protein
MESTFSSPAEAVLKREAGVPGLLTPPADLDRVYELERVVEFVRDVGCQRVRADLGRRDDLPLGMGHPKDRDLAGGGGGLRVGRSETCPQRVDHLPPTPWSPLLLWDQEL